jgi:hypothetical protein
LPSSWATEINLQSRYPGGILIPKIGELSSSAPPAENVIAPITLTAMVAAITKIGIRFMDRPFLRDTPGSRTPVVWVFAV